VVGPQDSAAITGLIVADSELILYAIAMPLTGIYFLRHAWLILKQKQVIMPVIFLLALGFLRLMRGQEAAHQRRKELQQPKRVQFYAYAAFVAGMGSFFIWILIWYVAIVRAIGY
jgi:hypothetical protein